MLGSYSKGAIKRNTLVGLFLCRRGTLFSFIPAKGRRWLIESALLHQLDSPVPGGWIRAWVLVSGWAARCRGHCSHRLPILSRASDGRENDASSMRPSYTGCLDSVSSMLSCLFVRSLYTSLFPGAGARLSPAYSPHLTTGCPLSRIH